MTAEPPALLHPSRIRTIADVPKYARPWYVLGDSPAKTLGRAARAAATLAQQVRILDGALVDQQQVLNARSAEIVELHADVAKWRREVKAVANRGQALVGQAELEHRAVDGQVAVRLGEHRMARDAAERALRVAEGQRDHAVRDLATTKAELDATAELLAEEIERTKKLVALAELRDLSQAALDEARGIQHGTQIDEAALYGRFVGGLIGVVVGVLVTILVVAAT